MYFVVLYFCIAIILLYFISFAFHSQYSIYKTAVHCCVLTIFSKFLKKKVEGMAYNMNDEVQIKLFTDTMMIMFMIMKVTHVIADYYDDHDHDISDE